MKKKIYSLVIALCMIMCIIDAPMCVQASNEKPIGGNTTAVQVGNVIYYACNAWERATEGTSGIRAYNIKTKKNTTILKTNDCIAVKDITYLNGELYFRTDAGYGDPYFEVSKVNVKTKKKTVIYKETSDLEYLESYFISGNKLYYVVSGVLYRCSLNGKGKKKVYTFPQDYHLHNAFVSNGQFYYSTEWHINKGKYYVVSLDDFKQKSVSKSTYIKKYKANKLYTSDEGDYYTRTFVNDKKVVPEGVYSTFDAYVIKGYTYYTEGWYRIFKKNVKSGKKTCIKCFEKNEYIDCESTHITPVGDYFIVQHFNDKNSKRYTWTLIKRNGKNVKKLYSYK